MKYEMENTLSYYKVQPSKEAEVEKLLNKSLDEISWLVEDEQREKLSQTDKYKKMHTEYSEITEKYPNVIRAYEDHILQDLTKEELAALFKIIAQDESVYTDEMILAYKIGVRLGASI